MIDERQLIKDIAEYGARYYQNNGMHNDKVTSTIDHILVEIVAKQPKANEWIPVEKELPKDLQTVNIVWVNRNPAPYYADIKDKPLTATGLIYKGDWYWWSQYAEALLSEYGHDDSDKVDKNIDVIAWKPIEPYTGDKELK